jgi:1-acyl-sn-glycerol-3-phosphate acyltransferase
MICMVYNRLHIHLWFLDVGMGFKNSRLFEIIQAASSFEGMYLFITLSEPSINPFRFSVMLIHMYFFHFQGGEASVNSVHLFPKNSDHIVVCNKTSSINIMTLQGQV